jgi:hypothetical protein
MDGRRAGWPANMQVTDIADCTTRGQPVSTARRWRTARLVLSPGAGAEAPEICCHSWPPTAMADPCHTLLERRRPATDPSAVRRIWVSERLQPANAPGPDQAKELRGRAAPEIGT